MHNLQRAIAATTLAAVVALGGLAGCDRAQPVADGFDPTAGPDSVSEGSADYRFTSAEEMLATSDVVIAGTVGAVTRGRLKGQGASALGVRDVHVAVDEVFKGQVVAGDQIVVEELGYDAQGRTIEMRASPWSRTGDRAYLFLQHREGQPPGHHVQIHPSGRLLVENGAIRTFDEHGVAPELAAAGPDGLSDRIRQLVAATDRKRTPPAPKGPRTLAPSTTRGG